MYKLTKTFNIGELNFDVSINRETSVDILKHNPKYWEIVAKTTREVAGNDGETDNLYYDIDKFSEFLEDSDKLQELSYELAKYGLPKLLKLAEYKLSVDGELLDYGDSAKYIIEYCSDNEVDIIFNEKLAEFIMLGFTKRAADRTPKVSMTLD